MNWLINILVKEARHRRFKSDDKVRFFKTPRKGTGKGVVLTPSFGRGTVVEYDADAKRYKVKNDTGEDIEVHPRNLMPDSMSRDAQPSTEGIPEMTEMPVSMEIEPILTMPA